MQTRHVCYFTVLLWALSSVSIAEPLSKDIIWLTDDNEDLVHFFTPSYNSIGTDTANLVFEQLSEYQIELQLAQLPRIDRLLVNKENVCVANRIKTGQREKTNIFSLPLNLYPGLRLYYRKDIGELPPSLLNDSRQLVSLPAFFDYFPNKVLAVAKGRSFDQVINRQLMTLRPENLFNRAGEDSYGAIKDMMLMRRIDLFIDYPVEVNKLGGKKELLKSISSIELAGSAKYVLGHIACSQSATGREVIAKVNNILLGLYRSREFYQAHARYIEQADIGNFDKYYHQVFRPEGKGN